MTRDIWCPTHGDESRHIALPKDGFLICGDCDYKVVRLVEDGYCVACEKYIPDRSRCENCGQKVCGRHTEKRTVMGFGIYSCPDCFGASEGFNHQRRGQEFEGDYSGLRFVWNKEKSWYEWDKDLSKCRFDKMIENRRKNRNDRE